MEKSNLLFLSLLQMRQNFRAGLGRGGDVAERRGKRRRIVRLEGAEQYAIGVAGQASIDSGA